MRTVIDLDTKLYERARQASGIADRNRLIRRSLELIAKENRRNGRKIARRFAHPSVNRNMDSATRKVLLKRLADSLGKLPIHMTLAELRRFRRPSAMKGRHA